MDSQGFELNDVIRSRSNSAPRLIAHIGTSHAQFALECGQGMLGSLCTLKCSDYPNFAIAIDHYLARCNISRLYHAVVAFADTLDDGLRAATDRKWTISLSFIKRRFHLETILFVNDVVAETMALPSIATDCLVPIGSGVAVGKRALGLIKIESQLNVGGLIPMENRWIPFKSEGGHVDISPSDDREHFVRQFAKKYYAHVSADRLLSESGIELIYRALSHRAGMQLSDADGECMGVKQIIAETLAGTNRLCREVLDCYCGMLGTVASNFAVTMGAQGGIYLNGGIVALLTDYIVESSFRSRFESKGRFAKYLKAIPIFVIKAPNTVLVGASALLNVHLSGSISIPILERVRAANGRFSRAEQKVANLVLNEPNAMRASIEHIAERANVSKSTVIRFCRTAGYRGLAEFKFSLDSSSSVPS